MVVGYSGDNCWLNEEPVPVVWGEAEGGDPLACADGSLGVLLGQLDVGHHLVVVDLAVDRATECVLLHWVSHLQGLDARYELGEKLLIDRSLHKYPACTETNLALVQKRGSVMK